MPKDFSDIVRSWEHKEIEIDEALRLCNMSGATFYRRLREYRLVKGRKKLS